MSNGLKHSQPALHARQKFLEKANDFNLYIEDTGYEFWYKEIFKRMGYRIVSVVASGDKYKVVQDYKTYGRKSRTGKLNFYLTDGDFWRYKCPEKMIMDDCFIYLQAYNIESYFINSNYPIKFLKGRLHIDDDSILESGFNFEEWKKQIVDESKELFLRYATIESLTANIGETDSEFSQEIGKTVSNAKKFLDHKTGFLDCDAWERELERINQIVENHNLHHLFSKEMKRIKENYESINNEDYYNLICGKYLFKSLMAYIKNILISKSAKSTTIYEEDFKWGCITSFDISELDYIKTIIESNLLA